MKNNYCIYSLDENGYCQLLNSNLNITNAYIYFHGIENEFSTLFIIKTNNPVDRCVFGDLNEDLIINKKGF